MYSDARAEDWGERFWPIEEDAARPVMSKLDNLHAGTSDR